jgi:hypothetical protein
MHLCTKKLIHKPNSGLELVVRQPKIQKVNKYIVYFSFVQAYCDGYIFPRLREWFYMQGLWKMSEK